MTNSDLWMKLLEFKTNAEKKGAAEILWMMLYKTWKSVETDASNSFYNFSDYHQTQGHILWYFQLLCKSMDLQEGFKKWSLLRLDKIFCYKLDSKLLEKIWNTVQITQCNHFLYIECYIFLIVLFCPAAVQKYIQVYLQCNIFRNKTTEFEWLW